MKIARLILVGIFLIVVLGRKSEEKSDNFVLVGASPTVKSVKFEDDKLRSAYYYPMMVTKPSSDYSSMHPASHHHHHTPSSLLNLNLGLLEPFMLVTFLLFVINLIDKAKILHIARNELEHHVNHDYENNPDNYYFIKRNSTV